MNDCPNADVRDLLPDLANARLEAGRVATVEAHVAGCADCRAELELLRTLRAMRRTPAVDVSTIAAAIPAYRAPARRSWVGWRMAAAITVIVVGGSSIVLLDRDTQIVDSMAVAQRASIAPAPGTQSPAVVPPTRELPSAAPEPSAQVPERVVAVATVRASEGELAMSGGALTDFSDRELNALLRDIESLDALPITELDAPVVSPMAPAAPARGTP